jgi:hypothetical protein
MKHKRKSRLAYSAPNVILSQDGDIHCSGQGQGANGTHPEEAIAMSFIKDHWTTKLGEATVQPAGFLDSLNFEALWFEFARATFEWSAISCVDQKVPIHFAHFG